MNIILDILHRSYARGRIAMTVYDVIDSHFDGLVNELREYDQKFGGVDPVDDSKVIDETVLLLGRKCNTMLRVWDDLCCKFKSTLNFPSTYNPSCLGGCLIWNYARASRLYFRQGDVSAHPASSSIPGITVKSYTDLSMMYR